MKRPGCLVNGATAAAAAAVVTTFLSFSSAMAKDINVSTSGVNVQASGMGSRATFDAGDRETTVQENGYYRHQQRGPWPPVVTSQESTTTIGRAAGGAVGSNGSVRMPGMTVGANGAVEMDGMSVSRDGSVRMPGMSVTAPTSGTGMWQQQQERRRW